MSLISLHLGTSVVVASEEVLLSRGQIVPDIKRSVKPGPAHPGLDENPKLDDSAAKCVTRRKRVRESLLER